MLSLLQSKFSMCDWKSLGPKPDAGKIPTFKRGDGASGEETSSDMPRANKRCAPP